MVYSTELGYDPDEWKECAESDHFLAMSPFTRICLSIGTVMVSVLFFWVLEANKRRHLRKNDGETEQKRGIGAKSTEWEDEEEEEEEETVDSKFARAAEEAALKAQPERRRNSKRELSRAEEAELLAWKAEVQRTAETRLRASEKPDSDAEGRRESSERPEGAAQEADGPQKGTEERQKRQKEGEEATRAAETDQQLIWGRDQQLISGKQTATSDQEQVAFEQPSNRQKQQSLPTDQQIQSVQKLPEARTAELLVPMSEWAKTKQLIRVVQQSDDFALSHPGATPPSTPPDGIGQNELAAHYRQMADELTQKLRNELDEMEAEEMDSCQMAEQLQRRHRGDIAEGLEGTAASPEMRHRLARQLESHVAIVVAEEMRKRASFSALAGEGTETTAEQMKGEGEREKRKSTDSSGESSEGDFVKVERHEWTAREKMGHGQSAGTALRNAIQANAAMASGDGGQNGLTPSPQMGGPATEEHEEQVRVSMFEGDGGSTTADEIEYVPAMLGPSKCSADLSPPLNERPKQQPLGAEEAEQMLALLQEYDLSAGEVLIPETDRPTALPEDTAERQKTFRGRQMSSGGVSSSGGVISLPGSTQRTTPAGSSSVPESPDSAGFVNIHPLVGIEVTTASAAEVHEQKEIPGSKMAKELDTQIGVEHAEPTEKMEQQQQKQTIFGKEERTPIKEEEEQQKGISDKLEKQKMRRKEGKMDGTAQPSSFIVEEEMLESVADEMAGKGGHGEFTGQAKSERSGKEEVQLLLKSPEPAEGGGGSSATMATSRQIGTNEAFDRPADAALLFEDIDDKDVTYAPEIQSLEVPPDQLSQADSLNLVDEEQFSEEHQRVIVTAGEDEVPPKKAEEQRERHEAEKLEEPEAEEAPQRELTPHEEENLQRIIDRLRRTPSPRPHRMGHAQVPQAPQFLRSYFNDESTSSLSSTSIRQSSLLSALGVTSTQEMLLRLTSLEALSDAMRKAGLESSNLIFGIDYTASNKYQGERSFGGQSLHSIDSLRDNPYQTVIKIMGRTLAPFAGHDHGISVFGFGDSATGDWTVFSLNEERDCENLEEVLSVYNRMTPNVDLSGPTNFAPLIYRAMEICQQRRDYHILVIIADGQVTNEKATVKAIVSACQFPLSIIVVGVGDGPWEMMRIFDESLPKRPWDNFHFVELHELINQRADQPIESRELAFAVHSLLEIPDQYATIRKMGLLSSTAFLTRPHSPRRSKSPKAAQKINGTTEGDEGAQEKETKETNC